MTSESGSSSSSESSTNESLLTTPQQMQQLIAFKQWVQSDAGFYGRTDDEFLLMFLRGCDFDMEITKTTLTQYYETRRDIPQWWANRNVKDDNIYRLLKLKITTALMDGDITQPTVIITTHERYGENLNKFDDHIKLGSIAMETILRRLTCQLNGVVWIADCKNYKWWFALRIFNPFFAKTYAYSFYQSVPMRLKGLILINAPSVAVTILKLFLGFVPHSVKGRIHVYGSDWSRLGEHVPLELLPEEYGGQAGPMQKHDDAFIKEVLAFNDYLVDDSKYGFQ